MTENPVRVAVFRILGAMRNVRIFRNNVGVGFVGTPRDESGGIVTLVNYRRIRFGLFPGSSDLIGWKTVTVTSDMVGKKVAIFLSIEAKAPGKKPNADQKNWITQVNECGGIAGAVDCVADAENLIGLIG
jgi:hypothetical protein